MKQRAIVWSVFIVIAFYLLWQFLLHPAFSLVDDAYSLTNGRNILIASNWPELKDAIIEQDIGRFRPVYLLYFSLMYAIFGEAPIGMWFGQALVLSATLILIYECVLLVTNKKALAFVTTIGWLTYPAVAENIFRLGTAEPRQLLFILSALMSIFVWFKKNQYRYLLLFLVLSLLAIGTKETSIMILPVGLYIWLAKVFKKTSPLLIALVCSGISIIVIVGAVIVMKILMAGGYASDHFSLEVGPIITGLKLARLNLGQYILPFICAVTFFIGQQLARPKSEETEGESRFQTIVALVLILLIIESFFFVIAWEYQFARYLYISWAAICMLVAQQYASWHHIISNKRQHAQLSITTTYFLMGFTIFFVGVFILKGKRIPTPELLIESTQVHHRSFDATQVTHSIASYLLNSPELDTVYTTSDNYEVIYELGLYASNFSKRPVVVVSSSKQLVEDQNSPNYVYSDSPVSMYEQDQNPRKVLAGIVKELEHNKLPKKYTLLTPTQLYGTQKPENYWWVIAPNEKEE